MAIDRSGEPNWPYGREDVAGDGNAAFEAAEAGSDLRTVYAAADAQRVWLRAYVAAESAPPSAVRAFFFLDADVRDSSGGPAYGDEIDPLLDRDPTFVGYERALGVSAEGDVLGAWEWDASGRVWRKLTERLPQLLRAEVGTAPDPLGIGRPNHGYLQLEVNHELSGWSASCGGALYVRLLHEGAGGTDRGYGDDALDEFACSAPVDPNGDPVVLQPDGCDADSDCPAGGVCRERVCLFAYECRNTTDCRADETCTGGRCVRVVSGGCSDNDDCDGLVCSAGACVACAESGARACAAGRVCSPNGSCVDPDDVGSGGPGGSTGGGDAPIDGKVQGGALVCSANSRADGSALGSLAALLVVGVLLARRQRKRDAAGKAASEQVGA